MKVILKDGTYSSKELCELCDYKYSNFNKKPKTLLNKLSKVCVVEENKIGNKNYYTLMGSDGIEFDSSKRKVHEIKEDEKSMSFLMKQTLLNSIVGYCNFKNDTYCVRTFDNWLTSMALVEMLYPIEKRNTTYKTQIYEDRDIVKKDFFSVENSALYSNFLSALNKLDKKDNLIRWYKVKVAVDFGGTETYLNTNSIQLKQVIEIENKVCEKYKVTSRNDLIYGNRKENIRSDIEKLKKFDEDITNELCVLGYKYTYEAFQVFLAKDIEYIKKNYLNGFDVDKVKNDIYDIRRGLAKKRQDKNKKTIDEKIKSKGGFNIETAILMNESRLRQLQYEEEYYKIWDEFYRMYIYDNNK